MNVIRAFGMRLELPRKPALSERPAEDLTTGPEREAGTLAADALHIAPPKRFWTPLPAPVPGLLIEGTLPEDHFARFVLRVPADWNGRLVVAASSGVTDERTYDLYFSDYALSRGYAFAATDKGLRRAVLDGDTVLIPRVPENGTARWAGRLEALAKFASERLAERRGRAPERVYAVGLSNGGYVARRAAESSSGLFHGALEISGVLWRAEAGNLLRELPAALRATSNEPWDRAALEALGFPAKDRRWDPLIAQYRQLYWEASLQLFLSELDPEYAGAPTDYDLDERPEALRRVREFENTGDLKAPLISIAGRRDYLISCPGHAEAYRALVEARGKAGLHELILVDDASHIDTNAEQFPFVAPLMPKAHEAFERLVAKVERKEPVC